MSTSYCVYEATIPAKLLEVPGVKHFLALMNLNNRGWARVDVFGAHFEVTEVDSGLSYNCECEWIESGFIEELLVDNNICLVYTGREWNSNEGTDEPDEEDFDPVALADRIPTLVLREVLAQRLAG